MDGGREPRGRRAFAAALATAAALVVGAAPAAATPPAAVEQVRQSAAEVRAYWTPERMEAALPGELLLAGVEPGGGAPADDRGKPRTFGPVAPATHAGSLDPLLGTSTSTRAQEISNTKQYPYRTHGKVFLTLAGVDYVCSGTVVRSKIKRLVATAGHCVYGLGRYASNWIFVPAWDSGNAPFGRWVAGRLATTAQWRSSEDLRYDVGMARMRKLNGRKLQRVVGARGIAFNRKRDVRYHAYGHPDGKLRLQMCNSRYQGADRSFSPPRPMRIACDMEGGASGGGWVVGERRVQSVTSYAYDCVTSLLDVILPCDNDEEGKLFGPYFGDTALRLYRSQARPG